MPRFVGSLLIVLALLTSNLASAQQSGSEVGGQPARRKVTKMPKLVKFVSAEVATRKGSGEKASVILTIDISETGRVTNVAVAHGVDPELDRAAALAARGFEFEPAEVDDK